MKYLLILSVLLLSACVPTEPAKFKVGDEVCILDKKYIILTTGTNLGGRKHVYKISDMVNDSFKVYEPTLRLCKNNND